MASAAVLLLLLGLLAVRPGWVRRADRLLLRLLTALGAHPVLFSLALGGFVLAGCALAAAVLGVARPWTHDEFSYLLLADTFAHGRLANPVHPLWRHFESFQILQRPHYASKYFPAAGVVLALGQVVFGHPIAGVWLGAVLASLALHWMLRQWLPPRWAVLGAGLYVLQVCILDGWSHTYWGGHVASIGGALCLGAAARLARRPTAGCAASFALGAWILANSRPYEGLVVFSVALALMLRRAWQQRERPGFVRAAGRAGALAALLLALGMGATGVYNAAVTGHFWEPPYLLYEQTFRSAPLFAFQAPKPVAEPESSIGRVREDSNLEGWSGASGWLHRTEFVGGWIQRFFLPKRARWALLMLPLLLLGRSSRGPVMGLAVCVVASILPYWFLPHYAAPYAPLVALVELLCLRRLRLLQLWGRPLGSALLLWMLLAAGFGFLRNGAHQLLHPPPARPDRMASVAPLTRDARRHLVIVHYGPGHSYHREWVYNGADIDASKIVWARDLGPEANRELLDYYRDRTVWLLRYEDDAHISLVPYPAKPSEKPS